MLKSLTYVSRSLLTDAELGAQLADILSIARSRNKSLDVTGALISSYGTFAQLIEGPPSSIDALMVSINRDKRHRDVKVISVKNNTQRRFPNWAMAYSGQEIYIDLHIKGLLALSNVEVDPLRVEQLESLMEEFSRRLV